MTMKITLKPQELLCEGLKLLSDTVAVTLGPAGQNVLIQMEGPATAPLITKDGVTVARKVQIDDPVVREAVLTVKTAAMEMNSKVGDGTTSTVILASALAQEILKVDRGLQRRVIQKIVELLDESLELIEQEAIPIEVTRNDILPIATIACNNNREFGELVTSAIEEVGMDGVVTFEESKTGLHEVDISTGLHFDRGFVSPYFINKQEEGTCEYENCLVFITDCRLTQVKDVEAILNHSATVDQPVLIIADDITEMALHMLLVNKVQGRAKVVAVKAPKFGRRRMEAFQDMALCTDGELFSESLGTALSACKAADLGKFFGRAASVVVTQEQTIISGTPGDPATIEMRAQKVREQLKSEGPGPEKTHLRERLARLTGGIGTVYVGGRNDTEVKTAKFLIEDGINACFAALRGGVVTGGGLSFVQAYRAVASKEFTSLEDNLAQEIMKRVLRAPVMKLISNALEEGDPGPETFGVFAELVAKTDKHVGYNVLKRRFEDLKESKILEPAEVPVTALKTGFGCGLTLGTTAATVTKKKEESKKG